MKLVASQTGRNESGTDPFGANRNEFLIELHPYHTWERGRTKAVLVEELGARLRAAVPGADFNFTQPSSTPRQRSPPARRPTSR